MLNRKRWNVVAVAETLAAVTWSMFGGLVVFWLGFLVLRSVGASDLIVGLTGIGLIVAAIVAAYFPCRRLAHRSPRFLVIVSAIGFLVGLLATLMGLLYGEFRSSLLPVMIIGVIPIVLFWNSFEKATKSARTE